MSVLCKQPPCIMVQQPSRQPLHHCSSRLLQRDVDVVHVPRTSSVRRKTPAGCFCDNHLCSACICSGPIYSQYERQEQPAATHGSCWGSTSPQAGPLRPSKCMTNTYVHRQDTNRLAVLAQAPHRQPPGFTPLQWTRALACPNRLADAVASKPIVLGPWPQAAPLLQQVHPCVVSDMGVRCGGGLEGGLVTTSITVTLLQPSRQQHQAQAVP